MLTATAPACATDSWTTGPVLRIASENTQSLSCSETGVKEVTQTDSEGLQRLFDTNEVSELSAAEIPGKIVSWPAHPSP
jgi:hypothetical protein